MPRKARNNRKPAVNNAKKIKIENDSSCRSETETSSGDDIYEVEEILNKRVFRGKVQYLIKWKNYLSNYNSWEPKENIITPGLVEAFEAVYEESSSSFSSSDEEVLATKVESEPTCTTIHGVCKDKKASDEDPLGFCFLISYSDGSTKLVPRLEAHQTYTDLVISYYQSCISFSDELEDFSYLLTKEENGNCEMPSYEPDSTPIVETSEAPIVKPCKSPSYETFPTPITWNKPAYETPTLSQCFVPGDDDIAQQVSNTEDQDPLDGSLTLLSIKSEEIGVEPPAKKFAFEDLHSEDCSVSSSGL